MLVPTSLVVHVKCGWLISGVVPAPRRLASQLLQRCCLKQSLIYILADIVDNSRLSPTHASLAVPLQRARIFFSPPSVPIHVFFFLLTSRIVNTPS